MAPMHHHDNAHKEGRPLGVTAPFCPAPACPPIAPMPCMDAPSEACCTHAAHPLEKAAPWPRPIKPCTPPHHTGVICKPPAKPVKPKCENILLQKIVCCEKRHIPQLCVRLVWEAPKGCPPYQLVAVEQSGAQPWWTPVEPHGPETRCRIVVSIPICCRVCDGEGRMHSFAGVVEAEVSFRALHQQGDGWRNSLFIVPCVQLIGGNVCSDDGCFCAQVEVSLEMYLLRPEPCAIHAPEVPCPDLPLYPIPPHWQRR